MNTTECLNYSEVPHLQRMAEIYGCECNVYSKLDMMKHLYVKLHDRRLFVEQAQQLPAAQLRLLQFVLFDFKEWFTLDDLLMRAQFAQFDEGAESVDPAAAVGPDESNQRDEALDRNIVEARRMIATWHKRGWLFSGQQAERRQLFRMPADLRDFYAAEWVRMVRLDLRRAETPHEIRHEKQWLLADLRLLLQFIGERGLELTQSGTIPKKWLQQYMKQCASPESLQLEGMRFGYGQRFRDYPSRFSLLYDFVTTQGWAEESGLRLQLTDTGLQQLLKPIREEWAAHAELHMLFRFWLRSYRRAIPNIAALVRMMNELCVDWVRVDCLVQSLKTFVKPYYYDDREQVLRLRLVPMMIAFGLLRVANSDHTGWLVQSTPEADQLLRVKEQSEVVNLR